MKQKILNYSRIIDDSENNCRPWRIVYYPDGDRVPKYKKNKPIVSFFDLSYPKNFGDSGQFVSEYEAETLLEHKGELCLYADKYCRDAWTIHAKAMNKILEWLREISRKTDS